MRLRAPPECGVSVAQLGRLLQTFNVKLAELGPETLQQSVIPLL